EETSHVAVDLEQVLRSGGAMEPVDVLREHADVRQPALESRDRVVRLVGLGAATRGFGLRDVLPADRWMAGEGCPRERVLDRVALVGGRAIVEAADSAVGRETRVGGNARARDEQHTL